MFPNSSLPRMDAAWPGIARAGSAMLLGVLLCQCSSSVPKSEVVVSVADQRMGLYDNGVLKKQYTISTSKFGLGDQFNSYRTPTGKHEIIAKIGHGLPPGAVLKSRSWNGEVLKPNAPGRDPIVSRILWLRGMENENRNAMKRYIYIHGTTEESRLGQPASYGCIRMGMTDVVDMFDNIGIGAKVVITKEHLPHGKKPSKKEQPTSPVQDGTAPAPVAPPAAVEMQQQLAKNSSAKPANVSPEKAAALAAAAAAPSPAGPVPVVESKKSFFPFLSKSRAPEAAAVPPVSVSEPRHDLAPNSPAHSRPSDLQPTAAPKKSFFGFLSRPKQPDPAPGSAVPAGETQSMNGNAEGRSVRVARSIENPATRQKAAADATRVVGPETPAALVQDRSRKNNQNPEAVEVREESPGLFGRLLSFNKAEG